MHCTGLSVIRGTDDLLVRRRDPRRDRGRGRARAARASWSGSPARRSTRPASAPASPARPIYCPTDGRARNAGAISEGVDEYGNEVALATPIEQILGEPAARAARPRAATRALRRAARPLADAAHRHRPVAAAPARWSTRPRGARAPAADRRARRAASAASRRSRPASPAPPWRPRSSSGDLALGAIGTVTYRDGDRIWAFGHPLDGARPALAAPPGRLRLRGDPEPARHPGLGAITYKLASTDGHVAGHGRLRRQLTRSRARSARRRATIPLRVDGARAAHGERRRRSTTLVADERPLGYGARPARFVRARSA